MDIRFFTWNFTIGHWRFILHLDIEDFLHLEIGDLFLHLEIGDLFLHGLTELQTEMAYNCF